MPSAKEPTHVVVDPDGHEHTISSGRALTHAVLVNLQSGGDQPGTDPAKPDWYVRSWSGSEANALKTHRQTQSDFDHWNPAPAAAVVPVRDLLDRWRPAGQGSLEATAEAHQAELDLDTAKGGHCTTGGSIASGDAQCECGAWSASDYGTPVQRAEARKEHLAEVRRIRTQAAGPGWIQNPSIEHECARADALEQYYEANGLGPLNQVGVVAGWAALTDAQKAEVDAKAATWVGQGIYDVQQHDDPDDEEGLEPAQAALETTVQDDTPADTDQDAAYREAYAYGTQSGDVDVAHAFAAWYVQTYCPAGASTLDQLPDPAQVWDLFTGQTAPGQGVTGALAPGQTMHRVPLSWLGALPDVSPYAYWGDEGDPSGNNSRAGAQEHYQLMRDDIARNGVTEPLLVALHEPSGQPRVIDGYHRWALSHELGLHDIPVVSDGHFAPGVLGNAPFLKHRALTDEELAVVAGQHIAVQDGFVDEALADLHATAAQAIADSDWMWR